MNYTASLLILFIITLLCSFFILKVVSNYLVFFNITDAPNYRKAHLEVTPRGGGLALILIIFSIAPIFEYISTNSLLFYSKIALPLFLISSISFLDDIKSVPIFIRFIVYLLSAYWALSLFIYPHKLFHQELLSTIDFILAVLVATAFINIYNFLDGIDGITAIESIHLSITILILCYLRHDIILNVDFIIYISVMICAWSLSFLKFNWPPAKLFIGDVGSIGIGFLLSICLVSIAASSSRLFGAVSIASLYYVADGGLTILIRLINGEKIWQPHLKHFFQKAIKKGLSNKQVITRIAIVNFLLMCLSISSLYAPIISIILAMFVVVIILINFAK